MRRVLSPSAAGVVLLGLVFLAWVGTFTAVTLNQPAEAVAAQAADDEAAAEEGTSTTPQAENMLQWLYRSLGIRYVIIFLIITFSMVTLWVKIVLDLRRDQMVPGLLVQGFEALVEEKRYQEAFELARIDNSFLGKILAAGMAALSSGYDKAKSAMETAGAEENLKLEQRLGYVALIAQIGPMFGLLGTVDGMVMAFDVIAHSDTTPKPSELAQGIGTALVTTVVGLWIAIPSIVYYNFVKNRLNRQIQEVGIVSERLMSRFENTPAAPAPPPAKK
jgi:biopolymer transport protein ExbB